MSSVKFLNGHPTSPLPERTNFVKTPDGVVWSSHVAVIRGIAERDGEKIGNIFIGQVSLPAASWIEQGVLDQPAAEYILSREGARQPAPIYATDMRRAPSVLPVDPLSGEAVLVKELLAFLEGSMDETAKAKLAHALRINIRRVCGMAGR